MAFFVLLGVVTLGLGPEIGPAHNYADLPDSVKWTLALAMYAGLA